MAKKKHTKVEPAPKPDLTPMIDIVFNLIIFFMIVSELSNLTVEELQLSFASEAAEPKAITGDEKVLQVNVMPSGVIKVRGNPYAVDPKMKNQYPWLADFLEIETAGFDREPADPSNPSLAPSRMRVNIRADKEVPFRSVQQVFDACQKNGVYRTSLAATEQDPTGN